MKKMCFKWMGASLAVLMTVAFLSSAAMAGSPVLFLADVSGSMRDMVSPYDGSEADETKAATLKKTLLALQDVFDQVDCGFGIYRLRYLAGHSERYVRFLDIGGEVRSLPADCDFGIYQWRHLAGHPEWYVRFLEIGDHDPAKVRPFLQEKFFVDYQRFNRRTALADALRRLDENELAARSGEIRLVLISDGRESFHNLERDRRVSEQESTDPDAVVAGPASEIRRLKEKYGSNIVLHTVFVATEDDQGKADGGRDLLARMAAIGGGRMEEATTLLTDPARLADFVSVLCPGPEKIVVAPPPEPEPPPAPVVAAKTAPADTDGDGVPDPDDQCPRTPRGAHVNHLGCWVLEGVHFDFDKWNIRADAVPILDHAVTVLNANPDLHVEVQGHTDSYGSHAYNEKLSERRAKSVMDYFIRQGVDQSRLSWSGYGERRPIDTNKTDEGRAMNRRVELNPIW